MRNGHNESMRIVVSDSSDATNYGVNESSNLNNPGNASVCSRFKAHARETLKDPATWIPLVMNMVRDLLWGISSRPNWNWKFNPTDIEDYSYQSQQWGQMAISAYGMTPVAIMLAAHFFYKGDVKRAKIVLVASLSAWLVIYQWDWGQVQCANLISPPSGNGNLAQFGSAACAGGTEGPGQYVITRVGTEGSIEHTDIQDWDEYIIDWVVRLLLAGTLGIIPGAVWQLVYAISELFEDTDNIDYAVYTGIAIMVAVALSNFIFTLENNYLAPILTKNALNCFRAMMHCFSAMSECVLGANNQEGNNNAEQLLSQADGASSNIRVIEEDEENSENQEEDDEEKVEQEDDDEQQEQDVEEQSNSRKSGMSQPSARDIQTASRNGSPIHSDSASDSASDHDVSDDETNNLDRNKDISDGEANNPDDEESYWAPAP